MKILVNGKPVELNDHATVSELIDTLQLTPGGIAVAVNNRLVTRHEWAEHPLAEQDKVVIIRAACGG